MVMALISFWSEYRVFKSIGNMTQAQTNYGQRQISCEWLYFFYGTYSTAKYFKSLCLLP